MAMKREVRELREALLDLTGILNRPQPDAALIEAAGVDLDRALPATGPGRAARAAWHRGTGRVSWTRLHNGQPADRKTGEPWAYCALPQSGRRTGSRGGHYGSGAGDYDGT
jgi:hypothetical protein